MFFFFFSFFPFKVVFVFFTALKFQRKGRYICNLVMIKIDLHFDSLIDNEQEVAIDY